jgi:hypothetical protein
MGSDQPLQGLRRWRSRHRRVVGEITANANGEPVEMLTGACSNPEPPEAITALPLGPLEAAWYMLARCDLALVDDAGVARTLDERVGERTIPLFEISFHFNAVIAAIKTGDTGAFTDAVVRWLSAAVYLRAHHTEIMGQGSLKPAYGVIPDLNPDQRRDSIPSEAAIAAVQLSLAAHLAPQTSHEGNWCQASIASAKLASVA